MSPFSSYDLSILLVLSFAISLCYRLSSMCPSTSTSSFNNTSSFHVWT